MAEHECVIGLLSDYDDLNLVTVSLLRVHIGANEDFNEWCDFHGYESVKRKVFTLADYSDKRKNTDLARFDFCPYCGKRIDWKAIRRGGDG